MVLGARAADLPAPVLAALSQAQIPPTAMAYTLIPLHGTRSTMGWQDQTPMSPASVFKVITTYAALDRLGPAWTWQTPVTLDGPVEDGVLHGSVWIRGSGDPSWVLERVWLMLHHLQQRGVREIQGNIMLDRSEWQLPYRSAADFDGDATRPYNVQPDALLFNFKTQTYRFTPDPASGVAHVSADPALEGVEVPRTVPLNNLPCGDWQAGLRTDWSDALHPRLAGSFPAACNDQTWQVAFADPASYNARLIAHLWTDMGGRLDGQVREGRTPDTLVPTWWETSPPLGEVVRNINKFSNNLMAEQLYLTLGAAFRQDLSQPARPEDAREALRNWLVARLGEPSVQTMALDNGSGLSRSTRVSTSQLAQVLQLAWQSPVMSELMSSFPISGVDGTLKRLNVQGGEAHLKTGSLKDVAAIAGYVLSGTGQRYVLVAIVNDPHASAARPALQALTQWAMDDAPGL
jgi:serine-type D-Ala-D-Ala carboxypeptidase/endopeptidase (penicillin-binding protein 4)